MTGIYLKSNVSNVKLINKNKLHQGLSLECLLTEAKKQRKALLSHFLIE